jgi:hypothetical protein
MKTKKMPSFYKWVDVDKHGILRPYSPGINSIVNHITYIPHKYVAAPKRLLKAGFGITGFLDKQRAVNYGFAIDTELWLCEVMDIFDPPKFRAEYQGFDTIPNFLRNWKAYNSEMLYHSNFTTWPHGTKMTSKVKLVKRIIQYI